MRKALIVAGLAIPLLLGALGGGYLFLASPASAAGGETKEGGEHGEGAAVPSFLAIDQIVVPVASKGRVRGYVMIDAQVEFAKEEQAKAAGAWRPKIVDAWLRDAAGMADRGYSDDTRIDLAMVKQYFLASVTNIVGKSIATEVVLQRAVYQPVR
jgi:hypothetical protein